MPQSYLTTALMQDNQATESTSALSIYGNNKTQKPYLKILEQPKRSEQRFRYEVEGRSAGSIKGVHWTPENNTYPTIEIVNCNSKAIVVISCVTKDTRKPHPHKVVGRDGGGQKYKNGICELTLNGPPYRATFNNLGIQCTKKKDMEQSLKERSEYNLELFKTPELKDQKNDYKSHEVRLCFQALINSTGENYEILTPVYSDPIIDKKAITDLVICRLCKCAAKVSGGDNIILLCEKVNKTDIKIKFTEFDSQGGIKWCAYADFQPHDIHKQTSIAFKTPRYEKTDISEAVKVFVQLERPSDKALSKALEFELYPDTGMRTFTRIRRKIKRKEELDIFQQILSLDSETTAIKYSCPLDTCTDENETVSSDSSASEPNSVDSLNEYEAAIRRDMGSDKTDAAEKVDDINEELVRPLKMDIEFEVPQIQYPVADECTQTSTPMDEILKQQQLTLIETRSLSSADKITEWMRSSEFERTDSLTVEDGDTLSLSPVTLLTNISVCLPTNLTTNSTTTRDDDKTFTELMEQVAELNEMFSRRETLAQINELNNSSSRRGTLKQISEMSDISSRCATLEQIAGLSDALSRRSMLDNSTVKEFPLRAKIKQNMPASTASTQPSIEVDETFDETSTYTSLKISLKNPIDIPLIKTKETPRKLSELSMNSVSTEEDMSGLVVLTNPPAPKIQVNAAQTPPSPPSPPLPLPPRTPSPGPDQKVPPLPPKRKISHELNVSNNTTPSSSFWRTERNSSLPTTRPPSQIIIMRTPEQSPIKRQSESPTTSTASPKKKQGFFARLFSRKKKRKRPRLPPELYNYINSSNTNGKSQVNSTSTKNFGLNANDTSSTCLTFRETPLSPEYSNSNSRFNMVQSPSSPIPIPFGMNNLSEPQATNLYINPANTNLVQQQIQNNQLPSMSGDSFTHLCTQFPTYETNNIPKKSIKFNQLPLFDDTSITEETPSTRNILDMPTPAWNIPATEPMQLESGPADSSEMTSEGRLVNKIANELAEEAKKFMSNQDQGLIMNDLISSLADSNLIEIGNQNLNVTSSQRGFNLNK